MAKNELVILRGVSGSGKSTWARLAAGEGYVIVSRDLIRPSVSGVPGKQVLDSEGEKKVTTLQDAQIRAALKAGLGVIVDDTNLNLKFAERFAKLAVEENVLYRTVDFVVPLDVLLARRDPQVPEKVVRRQFSRANFGPIEVDEPDRTPYVADPSKPKAVICDLDGTLANLADGFGPFDPKHYKHDTINRELHTMLIRLWDAWVEVIFLSGREATERGWLDTSEWLGHHGWLGYPLFMRPKGDGRNDAVVKMELFNKYVRDHYNVIGVFDDRDRVVKAWRARGIPTYQVADGDF